MWYYAQGEQQLGPVGETAFSGLVTAGVIRRDTLVWREGMPDWQPYAATQQRAPYSDVPHGLVPCVECGNYLPPEETVDFQGERICGLCKGYYFQRLREGHTSSTPFRYASVLQRFAALVLDSIILMFVMGGGFVLLALSAGFASTALGVDSNEEVFGMILGGGILLLLFGSAIFYFTWFVGKYGGTPGKLALGLRIVRSDGSRVSYLRAFARIWALELSRTLLYIGFVIAIFDEEKRTLHDHICDTRVIQVT